MTKLIQAFARAAAKVARKAVDLSVKVDLSIHFLAASLRLIGKDLRNGIDAATRQDLDTVLSQPTPQRLAYARSYEGAAGGHKTASRHPGYH